MNITMYGEKGNVLLPDEQDACAKEASGFQRRFWAKRYSSGRQKGLLYDPKSPGESSFCPCTEAQFRSYVLFLETRNGMHLLRAERP